MYDDAICILSKYAKKEFKNIDDTTYSSLQSSIIANIASDKVELNNKSLAIENEINYLETKKFNFGITFISAFAFLFAGYSIFFSFNFVQEQIELSYVGTFLYILMGICLYLFIMIIGDRFCDKRRCEKILYLKFIKRCIDEKLKSKKKALYKTEKHDRKDIIKNQKNDDWTLTKNTLKLDPKNIVYSNAFLSILEP